MEQAQDAMRQEQFQTDEGKKMQEHLKNGETRKSGARVGKARQQN
jgi:hypothetical protein